MDHARNLLAARSLRNANVIGLRLQNVPVHGVPLGSGQLADVVGRQRNVVPLPSRRQRLAVCGKRAANPVRIWHQERRTEPVAQIAKGIVVHVQHFLRDGQVGRGQHLHFALARPRTREAGCDLNQLHPAPRRQRHAGELRLRGAHGFAFERDDLLTADLGDGLGVSKSCRQNRKDNGKRCECAN
jgi:hypothetical protein